MNHVAINCCSCILFTLNVEATHPANYIENHSRCLHHYHLAVKYLGQFLAHFGLIRLKSR